MPIKALSSSIIMSKLLRTICMLILLPLLVPCEVFAKGKTTRVSVSSTGVQGNDDSFFQSISSDGRYVAFASDADNFVDGDSNESSDIFVHDRQTGQTTIVSVSSSGVKGNDRSNWPSISSDGRYVAFASDANNLVDGDSNESSDIFVHDRQTGQTTLVSVSSSGVQGYDWSNAPSISSDGQYVAFYSKADNLVADDSNGAVDIFVHDRQTGQTTLVSVSSSGVKGNGSSWVPSISSDGQYVAFYSWAENLVADDSNFVTDVFVHDRQTSQTTRVSVSSAGVQGNGDSEDPSISSDGRYVAFDSLAENLVDGDSNGERDVFVHDRQTGQTTRVSVSSTGMQGNADSLPPLSEDPSISSDGQYVTFHSLAENLVDDDSNKHGDIFVHDRQTGKTTLVSVSSTGVQGNHISVDPTISSNGRYVAFYSKAENLVDDDSNLAYDIFVHDRLPGLAGYTVTCIPLLLLGD